MCVRACVVDLLFPHDAVETQRKIEVNASGNSDDDGNTRIQCTVNVSAYTRMKCVQNDALHLEIKPNCSAKPQIGSLLILRTFRVPFKTPNTFYRACIERNFVLVQHSLSGCVRVVLYVFLDYVCLFVCCFACWLLVLRLLLMFILVCVSLYFTRSVDLIGTANVWSFFLFFVNKSCLHTSLSFALYIRLVRIILVHFLFGCINPFIFLCHFRRRRHRRYPRARDEKSLSWFGRRSLPCLTEKWDSLFAHIMVQMKI